MQPSRLAGQRFGMLAVVAKSPHRDASGNVHWVCLCDCGFTTTVNGRSLRTGNTVSCGCKRTPDLTGQTFGRLTVLALGEPTTRRRWECLCECGTSVLVATVDLRNGHTKSCGCYSRERSSKGNSRPVVSYDGAHLRIMYAKGSASQFLCVDCGGKAQEWSYDHADPEELWGGRSGCVYSLSPEHYVPRCRVCHRAFDRLHRSGA